MNTFQTNLYTNLLALCASSETFYYVDQKCDGVTYRIFAYRLASFTEFQKPGALECRGHTFELDADNNPVNLASMPMQKFFNLGENPSTMDLDLSNNNVQSIMDKMDGSLISTVITPNGMRLKSKTSFNSEQARDAQSLLNLNYYTRLREYCNKMAWLGFTVNMEYCSPSNRIVLGYDQAQLRVLNVRDNQTGHYVMQYAVAHAIGDEFLVPERKVPVDSKNFIDSIVDMKGIEGFVVVLKSGTWFKVKTAEYCSLHKTKDNINSDRKLFECCVMEAADDLRGLFKDDVAAMDRINTMEEKVAKIYNHLSVVVDNFYNENKDLDRKSYAIKGQAELVKDGVFGLAMNRYVGKDADLKQFMIKNYKSYGIKDDAAVED